MEEEMVNMSLGLVDIENRIFEGNVIEVLKRFPSECIDCVITSPPYFRLRKYSEDAVLEWEDGRYELGQERSVDRYVDHLLLVLKEVKRVLKKTGTVFWNMGDSYEDNSACLAPERFAIRARDEQGWFIKNMLIWEKPLRPSPIKSRFVNRYEYVIFMTKNSSGYYFDFREAALVERKDKSLGIYAVRKPSVAECDLLGVKVGKKRVVGGNLVFGDLLIAQGEESDISGRLIKIKLELKAFAEKFLSGDVNLRLDAIFGEEWKKWFDGSTENMWIPTLREWKVVKEVVGVDKTDLDADIEWFSHLSVSLGRNVGDVLRFDALEDRDVDIRKEGHFAAFPLSLVDFFLRVGCPREVCEVCGAPKLLQLVEVGKQENAFIRFSMVEEVPSCGCGRGFKRGIVLDPFMGSGTTAVVAKRLGYRWVGVEICRKFIAIAQKRLAQTVPYLID
jgi:DNA modification methylase